MYLNQIDFLHKVSSLQVFIIVEKKKKKKKKKSAYFLGRA